ncbi:Tetratricopeptide repeat-containing domain [Phaffia rhodozyma]|uniref:Tetratricopeptide repeat-containing domain n=1 Tax=Phaffia rhodozyma TaxID=264483 RepID=A0A0F7SI76_PHARH|nr:Tetratricopeptide repeat-containing domain [Phaffia rhodozyma]
MASSKPASNPKAVHYYAQLDQALSRGAWADENVAVSPKQDVLPWTELTRKWDKHAHGGTTSITTLLASHLRSLSLYLIPSPILQQTITPRELSVSSPYHLHSHTATTLTTSKITAQDLDGDADSAEDARRVALGRSGWEASLAGSDRTQVVTTGLSEIVGIVGEKGGALNPIERQNALLTQAYFHLALGQYSECIQVSQLAFSSSVEQSELLMSDHIARVRGRVIEGLAYEFLEPSNGANSNALNAYAQSIALLSTHPSYTKLPSTFSSPSFIAHRELHRWAERALYRGSILASAGSSSPAHGLRWLRTWFVFERCWPGSFRPRRRAAVYMLYLRALALIAPDRVEITQDQDKDTRLLVRQWEESLSPSAGKLSWEEETTQVRQRAFDSFDSAGTPFPKAGEKRTEIEDFATACVVLWELGGEKREDTNGLLQILWWATSQTFNSQPILRHLTRILQAAALLTDAKRTFRLYVQLNNKARETSLGDSSIRPTASRVNSSNALGMTVAPSGPDQDSRLIEHPSADEEFEDDRTFGETLLNGAGLLGKYSDVIELEEATEMVDLALRIWDNKGDGSLRDDERVKARARALVVKAGLEMSLAEKTQDPTTRPSFQASALKTLLTAVELNPSSASTFYSLAYVQAESREIDSALTSIRTSLKLDRLNIQSWHLLVLLLTAKEQWKEALDAVEEGLKSWDIFVEQDEQEKKAGTVLNEDVKEEQEGETSIPKTTSVDFAAVPIEITPSVPSRTKSSRFISAPPPLLSAASIPSPTDLVPASERPSRSYTDMLQVVFQLRITNVFICERLEGPSVAAELELDLFSFYADTCGRPAPFYAMEETDRRSSIFAPTVRTQLTAPSVLQLPEGWSVRDEMNASFPANGDDDDDDEEEHLNSGVTTINIDPPSPNGHNHQMLADDPLSSPPSSGSPSPSTSISGSSERFRHRSFMPKHLNVKGSKGGKKLTRTASLTKLHSLRHPSAFGSRASLNANIDGTQRSVSHALSVQIQTPSGGSPARSFRTHRNSTPLPSRPPSPIEDLPLTTGPSVCQVSQEIELLGQLWLLTAATCRRSGKLDEALAAIQEAELLDPTNPEVWVQLGLYYDVQSESESAVSAFTKSLLYAPTHTSATVHLARLYLVRPSVPALNVARALLDGLTQGEGWDCTEAWYFLCKVIQAQAQVQQTQEESPGRAQGQGDLEEEEIKARDCLLFAAKLEQGRPVRSITSALSRWT